MLLHTSLRKRLIIIIIINITYVTSVAVNNPQVIHLLASAVLITDRKLEVTVEVVKTRKPSMTLSSTSLCRVDNRS